MEKSKLALANDEEKRRVSILTASDVSEIEVKKKIKFGGPMAAAWGIFTDFTNNSSVHGVKYFGHRRRHWSERAFWVIAFFISLVGCSIMIHKIYFKWQTSPVIVSFAEKSTPVWQIPFPAITICPETKVLKKYIDFTKIINSLKNKAQDEIPNDQLEKFEAVSQVCDLHLLVLENITVGSNLQIENIVDILDEVSTPLEEAALFCKWRNEVKNCTSYFTKVITEEGICYTFNVMRPSELFRTENLASDFLTEEHNMSSDVWTLEKGYSTAEPNVYPRRVLGPGARAGLNVVLKLTTNDLDYTCRGAVQGFKILLHTPGEIPRVSKQYFRVPMKQEVVVSVKPNMITTSKGLADYEPERRQCYFNDERNLKFFKVYTQANCELECLANFTLTECGCVKFSMPRDNQTKICPQDKVACYDDAEDGLIANELNQSLSSGSGENKLGKTACNCLPSCTSINYDAEISQADFEFEKVFGAFNESQDEFPNMTLARLTIFFKEGQFITSKRSELYGLTDFMANCGGLLGLFMGVSILSLIEIVYYMTLRLGCHLKYRREKEKEKLRRLSDAIPGIRIDSESKQENVKID